MSGFVPDEVTPPEPGELVPPDVPPRALRDEINFRTHRAGYTNRDGGRPARKIQGTCPWGVRRLNVWPRDAAGKLIGE